ncbi:MAG: disulfide oxidoreductase [Anaerolineae bacterium]|nr:disulfide oxidoreductase [Anaerolineae bacterium]MCO5193544.1 disulfide oxidoreductase [Anaerolineae bacterium]MCO5196930.1 disulfide oxidoreductase [Anaerolineae bacterium]
METRSDWFNDFISKYGVALASIVALAATLGSLYFSEVRHFVPCTLCWYQRILMYPLVIITLVGMITQDDLVPNYVLPFSVIGIGVSTYHYLMQLGYITSGTACAVGVPCSGRYINWLGFVTIPFLALTAFVLITVLMVLVLRAHRRADA